MSTDFQKTLQRTIYAIQFGDHQFREDLLNDLTYQSNGWEDFADYTRKRQVPAHEAHVVLVGQTMEMTIKQRPHDGPRLVITFHEVYDENGLFIDQLEFIVEPDGKVELVVY